MKNGLITDQYGNKFWYKDDQLHREDGPAEEYFHGTKYWYLNGERHRKDGPAIEFVSGYKEWWYHGKFIGSYDKGMTNEKFLKLLRLKSFW